jgi:predicted dehydrogenase
VGPVGTQALRAKIVGAGSVGNHLANAARRLGWDVVLCDVDAAALERTRTQIQPARYGAFDEAIELRLAREVPWHGFDLIAIGTPPDSHVELALEALEGKPRAILVEKPVCGPDLAGAELLRQRAAAQGVAVFAGYDHVVGEAPRAAAALAARLDPITLDVEFREHWAGIFAAHPWLDGPADTYLGYWRRGGGASGEHSHAVNLWQHLARSAGAGEVERVTASLDYVRDGAADYDRVCLLNLTTSSGLVGRVVQDVVTRPARKWARLQGRDGFVEVAIGHQPGRDRVRWQAGEADPAERVIEKTRPDDFIAELAHIAEALAGDASASPIHLDRGLDTMLVLAAAHRSAALGRSVRIERGAGCTPAALRPE